MENEALEKFNAQLEDIESCLEDNPNKAIESSRGLLDSICKTVLGDLGISTDNILDSSVLVKETLRNLPFMKEVQKRDSDSVKKIVNSLGTIAQGASELRNKYSFASHGMDIESEQCPAFFAKLTFEAVKTIGNFITELHSKTTPIESRKRINYEDYEEFNEWFDDIYGDVNIGKNYKFRSSEALYNNDKEAYKEELEGYETLTGVKVFPVSSNIKEKEDMKRRSKKDVALIDYRVDSVLPGTVYFDLIKDGKVWFWIANLEDKKYLTYIKTKLKIGGYSEDIKDQYYGGEEPWKLNPFTGIHAPGMPIPSAIIEKVKKGEVLDITINCEIHDEDDKFLEKKLPVTFRYNFENKSWGLEP